MTEKRSWEMLEEEDLRLALSLGDRASTTYDE
jgi:hypothetical protein